LSIYSFCEIFGKWLKFDFWKEKIMVYGLRGFILGRFLMFGLVWLL